ACTAIGTYQCPSDPATASPVDLASTIGDTSTTYASKYGYYSVLPPGTWTLQLTSYAAASGAYPLGQSMAGIYPAFASAPATAIVQVTDGLSNTLAFAENTTAWLPRGFCDAKGVRNNGWDLPNAGVTNALAPNPIRYMATTNPATALAPNDIAS